jgi:hypothetical protein
MPPSKIRKDFRWKPFERDATLDGASRLGKVCCATKEYERLEPVWLFNRSVY